MRHAIRSTWRGPLVVFGAACILAAPVLANPGGRYVASVAAAPGDQMVIMAAGDSITRGVGSKHGQGWRLRFSERLNATGQAHVWAPTVTDHSGRLGGLPAPAQAGLADKLPAAQAAYRPDLIVINIGTNDAAMPELANWESRYRAMVQGVLDRDPDVVVVVVQPSYSSAVGWPRWLVEPIGVAAIHTAWWTTPAGRVLLSDWTPISACAFPDGVHPADDGYDNIADKLYGDVANTFGWAPLDYDWFRRPALRPHWDRPNVPLDCNR